MEDAINIYIEQQYYSYCLCLREYIDYVDKEEIDLKYGYIETCKNIIS